MQTQVEIEIERLAVGMYVAELDRPWLGTPFLFQGFRVTTQDEVRQLRQLCKKVTVDLSLGDSPAMMPATPAPKKVEPPAPEPPVVFQAPNRQPLPNRVAVDEEIPQAKQVQLNLTLAMEEAMKDLGSGNVHSIEKLRAVSSPLIDSVERNPDALSWLTSMRSKDTGMYRHAMAVCVLVLTVGRHMRLPRSVLDSMALGGLLFDVGKTRVSDAVLMKPDRLTESEFKDFQKHVEYGIDILKGGHGITPTVLSMVKTHHERFDGSGYPDGLKGDDIPALGKILGIADAYETMLTSTTSGRRLSPHDVLRYFNTCRGTLFDGALVEEFIQAIGIYPTGTLVKLTDNSIGVINEQNRLRRLQPKVLLVLDAYGRRLKPFQRIDLLMQNAGGTTLQIAECLEPGHKGIDPQELFL